MCDIRAYRETDEKRVQRICIETASPLAARSAALQKALLTVFCRYYVEQEPQNCFVAANERDEAMGYILSAQDFSAWETRFRAEYLGLFKDPLAYGMGMDSVRALRPYAPQYPAHLHIDILPACQRQGVGTRLIQTLCAHLAAQGVPGLMLGAGRKNERAIRFYRKCGFAELGVTANEILFGVKL